MLINGIVALLFYDRTMQNEFCVLKAEVNL